MAKEKIVLPALRLDPGEFKKIKKRSKELFAEWQEEEAALKEIRDHFVPYRGKFSEEKANKYGERKDKRLYNSDGVRAVRVLAAGLQSGVNSPARIWLLLKASNPEVADREDVKYYCDEVQRRMQGVFSKSNFYNSTHTLYTELSAFGTGMMFIEEDYHNVIRCRTLTMGEYALGLGANMEIDKGARRLEMTVPQLVEEFGMEALPQAIQQSQKDSVSDTAKKKVFQLIEPNPKYNPMAQGANKLPLRYRSTYWLEGEDQPLRVGGYHEMPFVAPRWDVIADQIYGRSPGWEAVSDVMQLQAMEKDGLIALAKMVNPPIQAPDSTQVNVMPGGITRFSLNASGGNTGVTPLYQIQPDLRSLQSYIETKEQKVKETFHVDLFTLLSSYAGPQRTAQEVIEIHEEKIIMMGPILERIFSELLDPVVNRVFQIMNRTGLLPDPPEDLVGEELKVEYVSVLAQAQKMIGIKGIQDFMGFVGNIAQLNPEVVDRVDYGELIDRAGDMLGVPAGIVFGLDRFEEMRKEKAQKAQEAQQMAEMAQGIDLAGQAAGVAKTLGDTATTGGNALEAIMGANAPSE